MQRKSILMGWKDLSEQTNEAVNWIDVLNWYLSILSTLIEVWCPRTSQCRFKKNLSSNNLVVWECVLSNLERCWRPQDLTTVRGYRASVYRSQITSSACDPAVVAQMCSPITHLHPSCSLQVIDGKLAPYLSKVIKFASSHVFSCSLCREKGFICELCHNGQLLYPFQESSIKR